MPNFAQIIAFFNSTWTIDFMIVYAFVIFMIISWFYKIMNGKLDVSVFEEYRAAQHKDLKDIIAEQATISNNIHEIKGILSRLCIDKDLTLNALMKALESRTN